MTVRLGPCPHCGKEDEVYINIRAFGWAQEYYGLDGRMESMTIEDVRYTNSNVIRCASCMAVRRDLVIDLDGDKMYVRRVSSGKTIDK